MLLCAAAIRPRLAERGDPLPLGPGFNCARAASAIEKAICADQALSVLDYQMSVAYGDLREGAGEDETKARTLLVEQRAWLRERKGQCVSKQDSRKTQIELTECLKSTTRQRVANLEQMLRDTGL